MDLMNYLITLNAVLLAFFLAAGLAYLLERFPWTRAQRRDALVEWCNRLADRAEALFLTARIHDQGFEMDRAAWLRCDTRWSWYRFRLMDMRQRIELRFYGIACRLWERTYA